MAHDSQVTGPRRYLDQAVNNQDPLSFLVIERLLKQSSLSRLTSMTPLQYLLGGRRRYQREQASLEDVERVCDEAWTHLVERLLAVQSEVIVYNASRGLRAQIEADAHHYQVRSLAQSESLYNLGRPLQEALFVDELRRQTRSQRVLGNETERQLKIRERVQGQEIDRLNRAAFEIEKERTALTFAQQKAILKAEQDHELERIRLEQRSPDKADPAYRAQRDRFAHDEYTTMIRDIFDSDDDDEVKHLRTRMVLDMVKNAR